MSKVPNRLFVRLSQYARHLTEQSHLPSENRQEHSHLSDFLLNFSVGHRILLGFLTAAILTTLAMGITTLQHAQFLEKQANFYQNLIPAGSLLARGSNILTLTNIEVHGALNDAQTKLSQETLDQDIQIAQELTRHYQDILDSYKKHYMLNQQPEQVALLLEASHEHQVTQQVALVGSAIRTWQLYKEYQSQMFNDILHGSLLEAQRLERLQCEPIHADALSALHGLMQFHEQLTSSIRDTTNVQERDQLIMTISCAFVACIGIIVAGLMISSTFVRRLRQLRSVTQAVEQGKLDTRLPVVGHDEITELAASVNAMLETMVADAMAHEQQRQLAEFKDQFIMNVSHELRTPLTQVYGFLELLFDYHGQLDEMTVLNFLRRAKCGCQELIHLVNSILDATLASSDATAPQPEEIAVAALARQVIDQFDPLSANNHQIQLTIPDTISVVADEQYFRQILRNLISNGCKYTPKYTKITLEAELSFPPAHDIKARPQVCITVRDTGPGIPPDEISQLFHRFVRLKRDVSSSVRGTGLGLYVCKQLVEAMKGKIWVESTGIEGEGCRFCFTLPATNATVHAYTTAETSMGTCSDLTNVAVT
ncbi:MAG: HAMP domain-containing protein [Chloroflexi bacterium]|nr:MAG: HAMP domain-containing protein [Chloroflexota bacterium]